MQASVADPAFLALADRVAGLWDRLASGQLRNKQ